MNLTTLRYFVAVAQYGSISKAAEKLYITQPALSRHIQRLENELGVVLLDRKSESGLTESGKLCLKHAKALLYQADQLLDSVKAIREGETGTLAIGYYGGERHFLYLFIKEIRNHYPNIEITFRKEVDLKVLTQALSSQELDFAFVGAECNGPNLGYVPVQQSHMQLMVSQDHPIAQRKSVHLDELKDFEFVMWKKELTPAFYDCFVSLCRLSGFEPRISKFEHVDSESLFASILASNAIGVVVSGMQIMADRQLFDFVDILPPDHAEVPVEPRILAWNQASNNPCVELILRNVVPNYLNSLQEWNLQP